MEPLSFFSINAVDAPDRRLRSEGPFAEARLEGCGGLQSAELLPFRSRTGTLQSAPPPVFSPGSLQLPCIEVFFEISLVASFNFRDSYRSGF